MIDYTFLLINDPTTKLFVALIFTVSGKIMPSKEFEVEYSSSFKKSYLLSLVVELLSLHLTCYLSCSCYFKKYKPRTISNCDIAVIRSVYFSEPVDYTILQSSSYYRTYSSEIEN